MKMIEALQNLRIVYAGTPQFAVPALKKLIAEKCTIKAAYTQPDRPQGRGQKLTKSPVKEIAEATSIPVEQPLNFKSSETIAYLRNYEPELIIVAAYGLILPKEVLTIPKYGCINLHPSLLPRYRGALPIQQAILKGDAVTGMTIMQMEEGLDSGPILMQENFPLNQNETTATLTQKLAEHGAELLWQTLEKLVSGSLKAIPQDATLASYTSKLHKDMARIDWKKPAEQLSREIRAFNPWPVSFTQLNDRDSQQMNFRIWHATALPNQSNLTPGTIVNISPEGIEVATGQGTLQITCLQMPGKKPQSVSILLNGYKNLFYQGAHFY